MAFADELREAGVSKAAVLHEFLSQHDPTKERIHAFVEGYEDPLFYRRKLSEFSESRPIYVYPCMGKAKLYEVFGAIDARTKGYKHTLFFPDKDLEDIIPEPYPKDNRIFTTDFYSIENYLVYKQVIERACLDFVRIKNCVLPLALEKIADKFEQELDRFHKLITPVMAWIVCVRRSGKRLNLQNVNLSKLFVIDSDLNIKRATDCIQYLCKAAGIPQQPQLYRNLRKTCRELQKRHPKTFIRGKFETWFLVEFFKKSMDELKDAATQCGGSIELTVPIERRNALSLLSGFAPLPQSLDDFLSFHLRS